MCLPKTLPGQPVEYGHHQMRLRGASLDLLLFVIRGGLGLHKGQAVLGPVRDAVAGLVLRMDSGVHRGVIGLRGLTPDVVRKTVSREVQYAPAPWSLGYDRVVATLHHRGLCTFPQSR